MIFKKKKHVGTALLMLLSLLLEFFMNCIEDFQSGPMKEGYEMVEHLKGIYEQFKLQVFDRVIRSLGICYYASRKGGTFDARNRVPPRYYAPRATYTRTHFSYTGGALYTSQNCDVWTSTLLAL